jgi:hypothetical protein
VWHARADAASWQLLHPVAERERVHGFRLGVQHIPGWRRDTENPWLFASAEGEIAYQPRHLPMRHGEGEAPARLLPIQTDRRDGRRVIALAGRVFHVARIVARAFHGPPPAGCELRHLNGNRRDDRASNLAWGTKRENCLDRLAHGTDALARLNSEAVKVMLFTMGTVSDARIAALHGVHVETVRRVRSGKTWTNISPDIPRRARPARA